MLYFDRQSRFQRFVWEVWQFKLTPAARILLLAIMATGMTGLVTFIIPVYRLFA